MQGGVEAVFKSEEIEPGTESLGGDRAADYGYRGFRQLENCCRSSVDRITSRWTIRIGLAILKAGMPLILFAAKGDEIHGARKRAIAVRFRIVEDDVNSVRIFLVFVDDE